MIWLIFVFGLCMLKSQPWPGIALISVAALCGTVAAVFGGEEP